MNAELVFFGRTVSMARRIRRRTLVAVLYGTLAALLAGSYALGGWRSFSPYVIWAAILACRLFLGGYYPGGLVKPFQEKATKPFEAPPSLLALKLHVYQPLPSAEALHNDEREVRQRDRAHFRAYQILGVSLFAPWFAASLCGDPKLLAWNPAAVNHLCSVLLLAILTLFLTLPQAILLWTEPDMEEPGAV